MYKPRETDKEWLRGLIGILNDRGIWEWPNAGLVYKFDKKNKVATLISGDSAGRNHLVGASVFEAIGWTVQNTAPSAPLPEASLSS